MAASAGPGVSAAGRRSRAPTRTRVRLAHDRARARAQLSGTVMIDYRPAGVVCTIDAPLEAIRDSGAATAT